MNSVQRKHPEPISIVVPVYRSRETIGLLVERLAVVLPTIAPDFEAILVCDGSPDDSAEVIRGLAERFPWVRAIELMRNYGQHNAILCGARAARFPVIVTMDDDLQHPPEEITKMLAVMARGYDVVYGTPRTMTHSRIRNFLSATIKGYLARALGISTVRDLNAFRAFRAEILRASVGYHSPNLMFDALLAWGTTKFATVKVEHRARAHGASNYDFWKLANQTMYMLTAFSTAPLRLASLLGFGLTTFGILVLGYVVVRFMFQGSVPGFPFIASLICVFSGAQMFALGIIGEYLARIFHRSLERPTYVVKTDTAAGHGRDEPLATMGATISTPPTLVPSAITANELAAFVQRSS